SPSGGSVLPPAVAGLTILPRISSRVDSAASDSDAFVTVLFSAFALAASAAADVSPALPRASLNAAEKLGFPSASSLLPTGPAAAEAADRPTSATAPSGDEVGLVAMTVPRMH